ncbi:MAG: hypothetical protein K0S32_810 [Bacteroidetes bacterium]|jgi:hypothetical protein|nr:hypothetical protein [Bacteroidota bacterium]
MDQFIKVSLIVHVAAGTSSLITGLLAMILKNNTSRHKKAGIVYFWCMTVVFVTGLYLSVYRNNLFLLCVSLFSYYAVISAFRILKHKQFKGASTADWAIEIIALLSFLGLIAVAALFYLKGGEEKYFAAVPLTFGLIGLNGVRQKFKLYRNGPTEKLFWLKFHLGNMIGSYIAAVTAFLVNQYEYIPVNPVFLWLGPTVILVPLIVYESKKVKTIPITKS